MPILSRVAVGSLAKLKVFGDDYPTADGTGVRNYIHVDDLAAGHLATMQCLNTTAETVSTWNLGTGHGTSVLELLHAFERASGRTIAYEVASRRPGDIATCFADPTQARIDLDWKAGKTIDDMCEDSWRWQSKNPHGYPAERAHSAASEH